RKRSRIASATALPTNFSNPSLWSGAASPTPTTSPSTGAIPGRTDRRWRWQWSLIADYRFLHRPARRPQRDAAQRSGERDHEKKVRLRHAAPEAAEEPSENVGGQGRGKPDAHQDRGRAGGGKARDEGHADPGEVKLADGRKNEVAHKPERARLAGRARSRGYHHEIGERHAQATESHLADRERFGAEPGLSCPQPHDQRREHEDHERIEREEPGRWKLAAPEPEIDRPVGESCG